MVEYCDTPGTERREQQGTQSRPKHRRQPLYSTRKAYQALVRQMLQRLTYNKNGLSRQPRDPLGLALQLAFGGAVTDAIVAQPENDPLLGQAGGFRWRRDGSHILGRKILLEDITHIITHCLTPIDEELALRFAVAELQRQMHGD